MDVIPVIDEFIKIRSIKEDPDIMGLVFFGSYTKGTANANSDVDLFVITSNDVLDPFACYSLKEEVFGMTLEGEVASLAYCYAEAENGFNNQSNFSYSAIGEGVICYDPTKEIKILQTWIKNLFANSMPCLERDGVLFQVADIDRKMVDVKKAINNNQNNWRLLYYNLLRKIQIFYYCFLGITDVPLDKLDRMFSDEDYCASFNAVNPEMKFRELFYAAEDPNLNAEESWRKMVTLYTYVTRNVVREDSYMIKTDRRVPEALVRKFLKRDY